MLCDYVEREIASWSWNRVLLCYGVVAGAGAETVKYDCFSKYFSHPLHKGDSSYMGR